MRANNAGQRKEALFRNHQFGQMSIIGGNFYVQSVIKSEPCATICGIVTWCLLDKHHCEDQANC